MDRMEAKLLQARLKIGYGKPDEEEKTHVHEIVQIKKNELLVADYTGEVFWIPLKKAYLLPPEQLAAYSTPQQIYENELESLCSRTKPDFESMPWQSLKSMVYETGTWWKTSSYFPLIMTDREARMMDYLINHQGTRGRLNEEFYCLTEDITRLAYIPPKSQWSIFNKLREKQFIETAMKGRPPKRWIKINYAFICRCLWNAKKRWMKKYLTSYGLG